MSKKQKKQETMKQAFDRMMADPEVTSGEFFKEAAKYGEAMDRLTADIMGVCLDYATNNDGDEGWAHTILISLARATCKLIYAMEKASDDGGEEEDKFALYHQELLPLCKEIAYREADLEREMSEREEREGGIPFSTKEAILLAVADPDRTVDSIIDEYFKKDITPEERRQIADHLERTRREEADRLRRLRDMAEAEGRLAN